jgi:hypothetical protein
MWGSLARHAQVKGLTTDSSERDRIKEIPAHGLLNHPAVTLNDLAGDQNSFSHDVILSLVFVYG